MAAPVVKNFTQAVIGTSVSSPADTSIGDLVVIFVWSQGTVIPTHDILSTFTTIRSHAHDDGTTDGRLSVACKVATAGSTQTYTPYTITNATANQTAIACITITGADTTSPATWIQGSSTNTGNQPPDPPSLAALTGDLTVFAIGAWHVTTAGATSATVMANYTLTNRINGPTGSHVTHLAVATRALTGLVNANEDPAGFTDNVTPNGSVAMTIAIPYPPPPNYINTRARRASVIGFDAVYSLVLPAPNTSVTGWDRCALAGKYIGFTTDGVVSALQFRNRTDSRFRVSPSFPC